MYYIGLDVHKKTISYCVKDVRRRVQLEGKIGSTRRELDCWRQYSRLGEHFPVCRVSLVTNGTDQRIKSSAEENLFPYRTDRLSIGEQFVKRVMLLLFFLPCKIVVGQHSEDASVLPSSTRSRLSGIVADSSGAVIPQATVRLHSGKSQSDAATVTDGLGHYLFSNLAPGTYILTVTKEGFAVFSNKVTLATGETFNLDVRLKIATEEQQVDIDSTADPLDPNNNPDGLTLKARDIDLLPDDPDQLSRQLQALSGSTQNQIYVDGYSGGAIPPKSMIREIRINQNAYSAKNDTDPIQGLIEIFTKPGTDAMHGTFLASGNSSGLNTLNPFYPQQPPYYRYFWEGNFSGPLSKHSSYFLNGGQSDFNSNQLIAAEILDSNLEQISFNQALPMTQSSFHINPRFDLQPTKNNTVSIRYQFMRSIQNNQGAGGISLATQRFDSETLSQNLQVGNTQTIGTKVIDETRFQYTRTRTSQTPYSTAPSLAVQGAFSTGGNPNGHLQDKQDRYELQDYISVAAGKHYLNFGGRLRSLRDSNLSTLNYNGQYVFSSIAAYQLTLQGIQAGLTPAQIRAGGGGASQFTLTAGTPSVAVSLTDVGLFYQDDWRIKKTLTLSYGLRYEVQNHISDHVDFGPRFGFAWSFGPKKTPFTLSGGTGFFYHRFPATNILNAARKNGVTQQQYVVLSPDFYPNIPSPANLGSQVSSSTYQVSPYYRAQDVFVASINLSRALTARARFSVNYWYARGTHDPLIRNVNAPLPGTYNPVDPTSGVRPFGGTRNIYQYDSGGLSRYYRLLSNVSYFNSKGYSLFSNYQLVWYTVDTSNGGFPSNQYNISVDKGPGWLDIRNSFYVGGGAPLPFHFNANLYLQATSSPPFNIVLGQDLNGDSQFNDRPTFATDLTRPSVVTTRWGIFDTNPMAGQKTIPYNYGRAPGSLTSYFSLSRGWSFGPELRTPHPAGAKGPFPRKYSLNFNVNVVNLFNHPNLAPPSGTLGSPLFGRSLNISNSGREILLQTRFAF
jgi:hypothetical protein